MQGQCRFGKEGLQEGSRCVASVLLRTNLPDTCKVVCFIKDIYMFEHEK